MASMKLTKGTELFWVPSSQYQAKKGVTVESVGRKWANLSNRQRIDIETMLGDGGKGYSSSGRAWPSVDAYEEHMAIVAAWNDLRNDIYKKWSPPEGLDVEAINTIRRALGMAVFNAPEPRP